MRAWRERIDAVAAWWRATRPARALARFGAAGGGLLTGGIAYATLFSIFAALTLGWTVFAAVLGRHAALRAQVVSTLDASLPGLVDTGDGHGLINLDQLRLSAGVSVAGAVAVVTLVLSAVSAVSALRTAVRAMLAADDQPNLVVGKLHELAGLVGIAVAVLVSAVLTLALSTVTDRLAAWAGHPDAAGPAVRVLGVLVAFVIDSATFVLVVRVLAGHKPPWRDLLTGAVIAGVGLGVLRLLGTSVVSGSLRSNPVLAPFAVVVVLLAWVNLMARIVLTAAAWTANPPQPNQPPRPEPAQPGPEPAQPAQPGPEPAP
ncbi:MAG TPA: YihY/virulence factor BrkB family protein [Rugosimonospora sp.]|nr:YihY/virulence factor BrkB family protein [Rugosimonospora sp.]